MLKRVRVPIALLVMLFLASCAASQINQAKKGFAVSQISIESMQETLAMAALNGQVTVDQEEELADILDKAVAIHNQAVAAALLAEAYPTEINQRSLVGVQQALNEVITQMMSIAIEFKLLK